MRTRSLPVLVAALAVLAVVGGCTSSTSSPTTTPAASNTPPVGTARDPAALPVVGSVAAAMTAVDAQFGSPQLYFEINATARLVNLFVSLNNGSLAQNFVYLDGTLTSTPPQAAKGNTFAASAVDFDPAAVLSHIATDLPGSELDLFVVEGGPLSSLRYTVAVTSPKGGQLLVVVDRVGKVLQVKAA